MCICNGCGLRKRCSLRKPRSLQLCRRHVCILLTSSLACLDLHILAASVSAYDGKPFASTIFSAIASERIASNNCSARSWTCEAALEPAAELELEPAALEPAALEPAVWL
eukprot:7378923-Prymnesium_polylepis.1